MIGSFPKQKVSKAEKTEEWYQSSAKWIRDNSAYHTDDRYEMVQLYKAAMGLLNPSEYKYVLNPYNTPAENMCEYPARIRNYDIITPIVSLFVGEKADKPFNHQVISVNSEAPNQYTESLNQAIETAMAQHVVNGLNDAGVPTGVPSQEVPPMQNIIDNHKETYNDKAAKFGQQALDYIKYDLNLKDKYQEALYDWIVTGRTYSYKDVYKNDLLHEIVPPLEMWHGTSQTGFVEDAGWAMRRTRYSLNDCIDRFNQELKDKKNADGVSLLEVLESKFKSGSDSTFDSTFTQTHNIDKVAGSSSGTTSFSDNNGLIDVYHCVWKSFRKYGILTYRDEFGELQELEVDESYKLDKSKGDISLEWWYENEVNETYIVGEDTFFYMRPTQVQRSQLNNNSKCKLPYNGRIGYSERNRINSVVKQLLPYQALYNIYHYRRELTLARNKDKIITMPKGLVSDLGIEKTMYFAEATSVLWFDETKPNAVAALNAIKGIDLGLGTYLGEMTNLLNTIKMEAWDSVGMNRQRFGDVKASDGKGNTEQAMIRSSVISAEMFRRFEMFEQSDLQGLLDYSKFAWIDGKKGMYINSDGRKQFLNINPEDHLSSDYGVFATNSAQEAENLKQAKAYAFGWAQKGTSPASTVLEVLASNNMAQLKDFVRKAEEVERQYQENLQKGEQAAAQKLEDTRTIRDDKKNATSIEVANIMTKGAIAVKNIGAQNELDKIDAQPGEEGADDAKIHEAYNNYLLAVAEGDRKKQELGLKSSAEIGKQRLGEAQIAVDREEIKSKEKIAKTNKNRYDS
jgi:hypothetical protein